MLNRPPLSSRIRRGTNSLHRPKSVLSSEGMLATDALALPHETVCYDIQHLNIDNTQSLPHWLTFRDIIRQAENNCIGVKGIKAIHTAVQNRLISHGFITTRVLIPEQNLHKGTLTLRILLDASVMSLFRMKAASPFIAGITSHKGRTISSIYAVWNRGWKTCSVFPVRRPVFVWCRGESRRYAR